MYYILGSERYCAWFHKTLLNHYQIVLIILCFHLKMTATISEFAFWKWHYKRDISLSFNIFFFLVCFIEVQSVVPLRSGNLFLSFSFTLACYLLVHLWWYLWKSVLIYTFCSYGFSCNIRWKKGEWVARKADFIDREVIQGWNSACLR